MVIELWENDFVLRKDKVKYLAWIALMSALNLKLLQWLTQSPKACVYMHKEESKWAEYILTIG